MKLKKKGTFLANKSPKKKESMDGLEAQGALNSVKTVGSIFASAEGGPDGLKRPAEINPPEAKDMLDLAQRMTSQFQQMLWNKFAEEEIIETYQATMANTQSLIIAYDEANKIKSLKTLQMN